MKKVFLSLGLAVLLGSTAAAQTQYSFTIVGPDYAQPRSITNGGYIYGNISSSTGGSSGAFYADNNGLYQRVNVYYATKANDAAGGGIWGLGEEGERWNSATGQIVSIPGGTMRAEDVDAQGRVVGLVTVGFSNPIEAPFIYADFGDGWKTHVLPNFGGVPTQTTGLTPGARAINSNGDIVGVLRHADETEHGFAYNYKTGGSSLLDFGPDTAAVDVNEAGQVLLTNSGLPSGGMIYDLKTGTTTDMGFIGHYIPNDINRWGQVIATRYTIGTPTTFTPLLWENGKFTILTSAFSGAGFRYWNPVGINDKGQIAAWGYDTLDGPSRAVLLTPLPGTNAFYPNGAAVETSTVSASFKQAVSGNWFALTGWAAPPQPALPPGLAAAPATGAGTTKLAQGYDYVAASGSHFAQVLNFPFGYAAGFKVSVGNIELGTFAPGQTLNFSDYSTLLGSELLEGAVTHFSVTAIQVLTDLPEVPDFSLKLDFGNTTGDFSIHARNNLPGDVDGDGKVDFSDFEVIRRNYGTGLKSWYDGDFTGDGSIAADDFLAFDRHINVPLDAVQADAINEFASEVPEPLGGGVLFFGALSAMTLRRRKR